MNREALERERKLREKAGEDAEKMRKLEKGLKEQIEHLQRKCACLRKLFDDMRAKLSARESAAEQEIRKRDREIALLRAEVARLTKLLVEQGCQNLGARTRADGCEQLVTDEMNASRRKGEGSRAHDTKRRPTLPQLEPLPPDAKRPADDAQNGRRRSQSIELPAVQVPGKIKQLKDKIDMFDRK